MNYNDTVTLAFLFTNKGATLSEVKAIRPGKKSKAKDRLLIELNLKNISGGEFKFRMVDVRFGDYINRKQINSHLEVIQRYYKERYVNKRYDSHGRWYKTYGVDSFLAQEKDLFLLKIQEYKREKLINDLIGKNE